MSEPTGGWTNKVSLGKRSRRREEEDVPTNDADDVMDGGGLQYEDPYADEFIDEDEEGHDEGMAGGASGEGSNDVGMGGGGDGMDVEDEDGEEKVETKVWRPGIDKLGEGEKLEFSSEAYVMYHPMTADWPCLSFDIIPDSLGINRTKYPMSAFLVAGTQAATAKDNRLHVMRLSELHKTQHDDESDPDDDDDDLDVDPVVDVRSAVHMGGVNRVRTMPQAPHMVASWSDVGNVHVWDVQPMLRAIESGTQLGGSSHVGKRSKKTKKRHKTGGPAPVFTWQGHPSEGFAMDWSPVEAGRLLTGDCRQNIYLWEAQDGSWAVDKAPFKGHEGSVEDLQWSHTEGTVFASCGVDKTIRIWDTRNPSKEAMITATGMHDADVNVISWNPRVGYLLASGSDDASFKVWDLRKLQADAPLSHFSWHAGPVTSIEWDPADENVLVVASEDNQVTLWDMSVELDAEMGADAAVEGIPPQLLFIHQGQTDVKEVHFHAQLPNVLFTTAGDGFNIYRPAI
jgi:ribosome assembly protein RRB1